METAPLRDWRDAAWHLRTLAAGMGHPETRLALERIADECEEVARGADNLKALIAGGLPVG